MHAMIDNAGKHTRVTSMQYRLMYACRQPAPRSRLTPTGKRLATMLQARKWLKERNGKYTITNAGKEAMCAFQSVNWPNMWGDQLI